MAFEFFGPKRDVRITAGNLPRWYLPGVTYTTEMATYAKKRSKLSIKESRLSIRVDATRMAVLARAAKQQGDTLSDFVLDNAYQMATELLVDEEPLSLSRKQVAHIFETLDHPRAQRVAALRKLLSERSVLDG